MPTRTGNFPIGFRRGGGEWQKNLPALAKWARDAGYEAIDLGKATAEDVKTLKDAGLRIGSVDLLEFGQIMSNDAGKRRDVQARNIAYVKEAAALGAKAMFTCIIPDDPAKKRAENYKLAVECFGPIAEACASAGVKLAIEGWPGPNPYLPNLCCTPETVRTFIKDVGSGVGLNYDPSHLIRLGVDHLRFLREFIEHVQHVHAKDTELDGEALYEYGTPSSAFAKSHGFGEWIWRYTIPGHGVARWGEIFKVLKEAEFNGVVSVELEDENFNGTPQGEQKALELSLAYLKGV